MTPLSSTSYLHTNASYGAYSDVRVCLKADQGKAVLINTPGSTVKSFLNNLLLEKVRSRGKGALAVADTLTPGECTASIQDLHPWKNAMLYLQELENS